MGTSATFARSAMFSSWATTSNPNAVTEGLLELCKIQHYPAVSRLRPPRGRKPMVPFRGFRGSPVTKGLLIATSATSVYFLSSFSKRAKAPVLLSLLAFPHPGALLLGTGLLVRARAANMLIRSHLSQAFTVALCPEFFCVYRSQYTSSTNLERQAGSSKHAGFVGTGIVLQALMLTLSVGLASTGPLVLLFSNMTMLMLDTPSTQHFTLMGVRLTDKVSGHSSAPGSPTEEKR